MRILISILWFFICSILWAYGGAAGTSKNWRRIGVPLAIAALGYYLTGDYIFTAIAGVALWGASTIGYGIPSPQDDGSPLGAFWYNTAWEYGYSSHEDASHIANVLTRGTVGVAYGSAVGFMSFIKGHWWLLIIAAALCAGNTIYWACFAEQKEPVKIFGLKLNREEFNIGGGIWLASFLALL